MVQRVWLGRFGSRISGWMGKEQRVGGGNSDPASICWSQDYAAADDAEEGKGDEV